jgi:thioredoxin 1
MNKEEFFEMVDEGITIVDFFAEWCPPCKGQGVIFDYLEKNGSIKNVKFLRLDVDNEGNDVARDFEIKSIPTIIIFKDGQEKFRFVGVTSSSILTTAVRKIQKEVL